MVLTAAYGLVGAPRKTIVFVILNLAVLIPVKFAPPASPMNPTSRIWRDLAIDRDSRAAGEKLRSLAAPRETLFVWGFRPEIFIYSGLPAGTRFLESQPISGVLADRHLFSSQSVAPEFTTPNRAELLKSQPTWVVDGLGPYNQTLALTRLNEYAGW